MAGYAIGADEGVLYLRGEYAYLKLPRKRPGRPAQKASCSGKDVAGKKGL